MLFKGDWRWVPGGAPPNIGHGMKAKKAIKVRKDIGKKDNQKGKKKKVGTVDPGGLWKKEKEERKTHGQPYERLAAADNTSHT